MYNIVIAGSTDFTADCIRCAMSLENVNLSAVISLVDTKKDRKGNILLSPPSKIALEEHIPLFRPENINDISFHKKLSEIDIDFLIVVAYGKILTPKTMAIPKISSLNIHGSLLPELRGASPVEYAIFYGLNRTGVTLQKMSTKLDEGDIILQREIKIKSEWHHSELYEEVKEKGVMLLEDFFEDAETFLEEARHQDKRHATYCKKIKKEDGKLDFTKKARELHNQIRAFSDWPVCYCDYKDNTIKIYKSKVIDENRLAKQDYGCIIEANDEGLLVQTGSGILSIKELQRSGKNKQNIKEFLNGTKIKKGEYLE